MAEEIRIAHPDCELLHAAEGEASGHWDSDRVAQVLTNLVTNAVQYGAANAPISISTRGDQDHVVLQVHNHGAAIPADRLPVLFQPMQRGPQIADRASRSVGLGLYIVREIVRRHGGTIDVTSTEDEGTTFRVRLPRR